MHWVCGESNLKYMYVQKMDTFNYSRDGVWLKFKLHWGKTTGY